MKYINKLAWSLIFCACAFTACNDDNEPNVTGGISLDKAEITMGAEGGSEEIKVTSSESWTTHIQAPWIMISPANGNGSMTTKVSIDSTLEYESRSAELQFRTMNGEPKTITVTQLGYGKHIYLKKDEIELENSAEYKKRTLECHVTANVECIIQKVEYSFETDGIELTEEEMQEAEKEKNGWLLNEKEKPLVGKDLNIVLDEKARPRTVKLNCRWKMNIVPLTRVAKVYFAPKNADDQLVNDKGEKIDHVILTVRQKPALKIEDNRTGDSLAVVLINEKIKSMYPIETSENMRNWTCVTLWEEGDKDIPEGAAGRVRSVNFKMINLADGEELPREVGHLKYLESFYITSNDNSQIRNVALCKELCNLDYLKFLTVRAFGLSNLPENFKNLGKSLEILDLGFNGFTSLATLTQIINKQNFPKLRRLHLYGQRKNDNVINLYEAAKNGYTYNGYPLGMHFNMTTDSAEKNAFLNLLLWEELEALEMSYCFIEGELPSDAEVQAALEAAGKPLHYREDDFSENKKDYYEKLVGDTCRWLLSNDNPVTCKKMNGEPVLDRDNKPVTLKGQEVLRVLPRARALSLNLNFFTGTLPNWILFHPHFLDWMPLNLLFNQQEKGFNSDNQPVGFKNIDADNFNYSYYYGDKDPGEHTSVKGVAYPLYYRIYVANNEEAETGFSNYLRK